VYIYNVFILAMLYTALTGMYDTLFHAELINSTLIHANSTRYCVLGMYMACAMK
jgi:hypothetical protein